MLRLVKPALLALAVSALAAPAHAGEAGCWFENGVLVVTAQVAGVTGDYILDIGQPQTQLGETQAQTAGYTDTLLSGEVRLAGVALPASAIAVADLDVRTGLLPTPIAGIIGADVLKGQVVDVSFAPACRIRLSTPDQVPAFRVTASLPIAWEDGRPLVPARISDGTTTVEGRFVPATGGDAAIRISDTLADAPGASKPAELYPYGVLRPALRRLTFGGRRLENLPAGLLPRDRPGDGELGAPVLARFRLRFDFPAGVLSLGPAS